MVQVTGKERRQQMIGRIGLLVGVIHACAGVEVPGYQDKYQPLPGTERYTPESLVRNFENIFDEQMLEALHKELEPLDTIAKGSGALRNSKRVTFWLGSEREPRCAVERAVKLLEEVRPIGNRAPAILLSASRPACSVHVSEGARGVQGVWNYRLQVLGTAPHNTRERKLSLWCAHRSAVRQSRCFGSLSDRAAAAY